MSTSRISAVFPHNSKKLSVRCRHIPELARVTFLRTAWTQIACVCVYEYYFSGSCAVCLSPHNFHFSFTCVTFLICFSLNVFGNVLMLAYYFLCFGLYQRLLSLKNLRILKIAIFRRMGPDPTE
jgi:hypothetical protein